eukprot:CAMPEP_0202967182 /NCGR_PEP_ID=MMETSP1396-20130829/11962_1 /ASSEMBLY_ACC=CAM_ASM_000872 /TAXON_ID= /ORGANISM="Pseudokeronopsis sp., Strain Brazil" /LENGTH=78 /DNA_ID=CAMNT_0049691941 /DNA_START=451 /DNA_END=687 /DNA_ORIENTATION=+
MRLIKKQNDKIYAVNNEENIDVFEKKNFENIQTIDIDGKGLRDCLEVEDILVCALYYEEIINLYKIEEKIGNAEYRLQ